MCPCRRGCSRTRTRKGGSRLCSVSGEQGEAMGDRLKEKGIDGRRDERRE